MYLTKETQIPFMKLIFCLMTVSLVIAGCNSSGLRMTTNSQDEIRYMFVNYQGVSVRLTSDNNGELIKKIFKEISSTKVESYPNPDELESQESEPKFSLVLGYDNGSEDVILSTETGELIFRRLAGNGWIGGRNKNLYKLIIDVTRGQQVPLSPSNLKTAIKFSVFLEKKLNGRSREAGKDSIELEDKPVCSDVDIPYSWDGNQLILDKRTIEERLRGKIPMSGRLFVLIIGEKKTSVGMFWTLLSSAIPPTNIPVITFDEPGKDIIIYSSK